MPEYYSPLGFTQHMHYMLEVYHLPGIITSIQLTFKHYKLVTKRVLKKTNLTMVQLQSNCCVALRLVLHERK